LASLFGEYARRAETRREHLLELRRASNRLGFAVQLCVLCHPGRVLDPAELPPAPMLALAVSRIVAAHLANPA
jgi:hypothetical protein